jgi:hypothetical protein
MNQRMRRILALSILAKAGIPLLLGLITIVSAHISGVSSRSALELGGLVGGVLVLASFLIDFEIRFLTLERRITEGFQRIGQSTELTELVERSALDTELLIDFLRTAGQADADVSPMLLRLARRELKNVTWFVRQLRVSREIAYDGEDREWLLGLTEEAERTIDAISLSTVDAGMLGFDGGLWTSDLGTRYLKAQREAIARKVSIRRIFVVEHEDLAQDPTFRDITERQRAVGIDVRMLDHKTIPDWLRSMIFDYIIFDGAVSYEMTPFTTFAAGGTRPAIVRTLLAPMPDRVGDLENRFQALWEAADPDRPMPD